MIMRIIISHIMGLFYRTIRMMENGIKPVYVFDGKPPTLKSGEVTNIYFNLLKPLSWGVINSCFVGNGLILACKTFRTKE
jgi:hypothetical protein